ncbi:MAG TPA: MFS transporter, partial [Polyangia bacterium]
MTVEEAKETEKHEVPRGSVATASEMGDHRLAPGLIALLACGAGLGVASIYYNQPMLGALAADFSASPTAIGRIPTLTQLGYAAGILFLAPLGDRHDRRRVILLKTLLLGLALLTTACLRTLWQLSVLSVAVGIAATVAQDYVPAAATLAPAKRRGRIVGSVMTGLLLGILLSRVVSGAVTEWLGWRAMFAGAAGLVVLLGAFAARRLPRFAPTTNQPYTALLASLWTLWRRHPEMRRAALAQGCLSAAFSAFWSTLAVMLHRPPCGFGASVAGAFGLAGAAGALAAPVAGRLADRNGPEPVTRLGALLVVASFVGFALAPHSLVLLIVGAVVFDLGIQASMIAHQSIVYGLDPAARSRLNALLLGTMFVGMSVGSALGSLALDRFGWGGVGVFGAV